MKKNITQGTLIFLFLSYLFYEFGMDKSATTNIAFVETDVISLSAKDSGSITSIAFQKNTAFTQDDVLFSIENTAIKRQLDLAKLDLVSSYNNKNRLVQELNSVRELHKSAIQKTQHLRAKNQILQEQLARVDNDFKTTALSGKELNQLKIDEIESNLSVMESEDVETNLSNRLDQLEQLILESDNEAQKLKILIKEKERYLSERKVRAPFNGVISDVVRQQGEYVQSGESILMIFDSTNIWIQAYFSESAAANLSIGRRVKVNIDAYPDSNIIGIIESISPLAGAKLSAIPANYATGNFTRISQRVPVRINISDSTITKKLKPGFSAKVSLLDQED